MLLPSIIDDYVSIEDPVRAYDAFVDTLNLQELGLTLMPRGNADEYYPKAMLKLFIYGYAYGIRSSRKLERACQHNLSFIWLMGGLKPDYRTIARFRQDHKEVLKKVLKQCVRLCIKLGLIEGNALFIDGSAMRADASMKHTWDIKRCDRHIQKLNERIDRLVDEKEPKDSDAEQEENLVKLKGQLRDKEQLKKAVEEFINETQRKSLNTIDSDSVNTKGRQGTHAGYKAQITADGKHGLIVNSDALSQSMDSNELHGQVQGAQENLGYKPKVVCADSGYYSPETLNKIDKDITLVVPSPETMRLERGGEANPFNKEQFIYNEATDTYTCPAGKILKYSTIKEQGRVYQAQGRDCRACAHFGACTKRRNGRTLIRMTHEALQQSLKAVYKSDVGQAIYKLRQQTVELIFGHFKRNQSAGQFLLRGRLGVNAELSLLSTGFNMARMITLMGGVLGLILRLKSA
jgi:transposase